jgi:hypothetical protein
VSAAHALAACPWMLLLQGKKKKKLKLPADKGQAAGFL